MSESVAPAVTRDVMSSWPAWYREWRDVNGERFEAWGLPTRRQENWRYTPLKAFEGDVASALEPGVLEPEDLAELDLPPASVRITLVDGRFRPELSLLERLPEGVTLTPLAAADEQALGGARVLLEHGFPGRDETTAALAASRADEGWVLEVAADRIVDTPIQVVQLWTEAAGRGWSHQHLLVHVGRGASLGLVDLHLALGAAESLGNHLTSAVLEAGASLDVHHVQSLGDTAGLVTRVDVRQGRDSTFRHQSFDFGGRLVRHDINCRLEGSGAHASMEGVYALSGKRHVDNHTRVDHLASDTSSDEHYKGVLDGESRGVFNGKVVVAEGTARIDASQINRNLLLSRTAEIDTKPELEIYADDVKCAHGATVGQLDERQLFYLRSRGIPAEAARLMLIDAFCREIVERVGDEALRAWIGERLAAALPRQAEAAELDGQGAES